VQQATKLRYMSGGQVKIPLVLQMPTGASGRGAQHANAMESFFFHIPGLKIVTPASPYDAKGLLKSAIRDDNLVLFCVHKHLYGSKGRKLTEAASAPSMCRARSTRFRWVWPTSSAQGRISPWSPIC
ncbi:MAG: hypothetical protein HC802_21185, partial [Caldilineaceae bacterium]|nr:hypothetical protein [Caldilineaceae bacterium]